MFYVLLQRVSERQWPFRRADAPTSAGHGHRQAQRRARRQRLREETSAKVRACSIQSLNFVEATQERCDRAAARGPLVWLHWSAPTTSAPTSMYLPPGGSASTEAGEISNIAWWDQFQDPVLSNLVRTALANNKDLKIATANVDQAAAQYGIVRSAQFPQIDAGAIGGAAGLEPDHRGRGAGRGQDSTTSE